MMNEPNTLLTNEATIRALTRRATDIYANTHHMTEGHGRRTGENVILGIGEAMCVLELVSTPFLFTEAFYAAVGLGGPTPPEPTHRNAWTEFVIDTVARAVMV